MELSKEAAGAGRCVQCCTRVNVEIFEIGGISIYGLGKECRSRRAGFVFSSILVAPCLYWGAS